MLTFFLSLLISTFFFLFVFLLSFFRGRLPTGAEGLFPSNFVEEQGKTPTTDTPVGDSNSYAGDYVALYDYDAEDENELTIKEGEALYVESEKDLWFFGYRKADPSKKGTFPSNFVERSG